MLERCLYFNQIYIAVLLQLNEIYKTYRHLAKKETMSAILGTSPTCKKNMHKSEAEAISAVLSCTGIISNIFKLEFIKFFQIRSEIY